MTTRTFRESGKTQSRRVGCRMLGACARVGQLQVKHNRKRKSNYLERIGTATGSRRISPFTCVAITRNCLPSSSSIFNSSAYMTAETILRPTASSIGNGFIGEHPFCRGEFWHVDYVNDTPNVPGFYRLATHDVLIDAEAARRDRKHFEKGSQ